MSRVCELTGKAVMSGNNVSHALNRTRRKFRPNLTKVTLMSDALGQSVKMKISAHALRSVEHNGGLDNFLVKANDVNLSLKARRLKKNIKKKQGVKLVGFGTFEVSNRKSRVGRNPQTGEEIQIPARRVPVFRAGKELKTVCS